MLENHAFKLVKFRSCWDYDTRLHGNSGAPGRQTLRGSDIYNVYIPQVHTWIRHSNLINIQSSRYLNQHDYLQAVRYQSRLQQHSPAPNMPVQLLLQTDTLYILFICFTTRMNPSTQSAQPWTSLIFVGITTVYSSTWGRNTHWWVFFHLLKMVDIALPAGRHCWNWRIWFGGVQLKNNTGKEGIRPWSVLSRSFSSLSVYWTQLLWALGMIPWLALVYSTLQSSPRCSTDVGQWNGWR